MISGRRYDHVRTGSNVIRHSVIRQAGLQCDDLRIAQDLEYWGYLATFGKWAFIPRPLWVGNSRRAARRQGWLTKYRNRRKLCPEVEQWGRRIEPRLPPCEREAYTRVRGRVALIYAQNKILAGARASAYDVVEEYGSTMPACRLSQILWRRGLGGGGGVGSGRAWRSVSRNGARPAVCGWVGGVEGEGARESGVGDQVLPGLSNPRVRGVVAAVRGRLFPRFQRRLRSRPVPQESPRRSGSPSPRAHRRACVALGAPERFCQPGRAPSLSARTRACRPAQEPEVLITDGFFQWTWAALWLRMTRGIPHVMCYEKTAHTERNAQRYRTAYRRLALRWIDALCCNGTLCGEYVRSLGFPADRITYGHMAADVTGLQQSSARSDARAGLGIESTTRARGRGTSLCWTIHPAQGDSRIAYWMAGIPHAVGAASHAAARRRWSAAQELQHFCQERTIPSVRFAGAVDYDAVAPYYKCANALVMPTLEDNWSLVVPEAMACGLPILCSKYNGCWPELVTPANGWVFDPLVPSDVVSVLTEAASSKTRLAQMGEVSRTIVNSHTASDAAAAIYEAVRLACRRKQAGRVYRPGVPAGAWAGSNHRCEDQD